MHMRVKFVNNNKQKIYSNLTPFAQNEVSSSLSWREGRRVVELGLLVDNLEECANCGERLHLKNIIKETVQGLASILYVKCQKCQTDNSVPTGKRHGEDTNGTARCFDVNTKLAAAMIHAGIGEQQVNNILAELNLPPIHHKTLKEREREIGASFEDAAEDSCARALEEEVEAVDTINRTNCATPVATEVSSDGAWQRRGTGRSHNSLSGHVTMIGKLSKKCVSFGVAKKACRVCISAGKRQETPRKHSCRKNWTGSSKAMEPFLTINSLRKVKEKGLKVQKITMDDDTSTFIRAKRSLSMSLEKSSDRNHVIRNMTNELYRLKQKHKSLSVRIINYFKKCFSYNLSQNKGNADAIRSNMEAIVPHAFGNHAKCNPKWCKFHTKKEKYMHASLPFGRDLQGTELETDLECLFSRYSTGHMSEKLSDLQSSNANESLNQIISRKAPKALHYSGSESLDYRMSAAVSQKNEGHSYILKVNQACGLSPGKYSIKQSNKLNHKRDAKRKRQSMVETKKRRLELKEKRLSLEASHEVHEGKTYEPSVDMNSVELNDIENIPPPPVNPVRPTQRPQNTTVVVFDLETTGLSTDSSIIQLAARNMTTGESFNNYVLPQSGIIPSKITSITGIEVNGGVMFHYMSPVSSTTIRRALERFRDWLLQVESPLLVAHNVHFDARILINSCMDHHIQLPNVTGFSDSISLFKQEFPGKSSYRQSALVRALLKKDYDEHNAAADVTSLTELLELVSDLNDKLSIITVDEVVFKICCSRNEKKNLSSYAVLIDKKVLPKTQAKKLASSGLSMNHIQLVADRSGIDGVATLLKGRGSKNDKVADKLFAETQNKIAE